MYEIYLMARGRSVAVVGDERVCLSTGDMLVVEPGEVHTFTDSSEDYLHFVVQTPFVKGDKVDLGRGRSRLTRIAALLKQPLLRRAALPPMPQLASLQTVPPGTPISGWSSAAGGLRHNSRAVTGGVGE
jgi:hypothetical protein